MEDILIGTTDRTILVFIPDPAQTDGSGKTGLVAANLTVTYTRVETDNDVVRTDVTSSLSDLSALTDAHADWGWKEVDSSLAPGLYRLDLADAVFATGAWYAVVYVMITTSAAAATPKAFKLVAYNPLDGVRLGLTALPNAAAEAAGGLYTRGSGAGQINQNANGQIDSRVVASGTAAINRAALDPDTGLQTIRSGTAQAASASTITLDAGASSVGSFYVDTDIYTTGGTGAGQCVRCIAYDGGTKQATVTPNWVTQPDSTTTFAILPRARVTVGRWLAATPNALISGRVDANAQVVGDKTGYTATVSALTTAAVQDLFTENSGETYSSAVAGSLVKEIADNAHVTHWAGVAAVAGAIPAAAAGTASGLALTSAVTAVGTAVGNNGTAIANLAIDVAAVPEDVHLFDWETIVAAVPDYCLLKAARFLRNKWSPSGSQIIVFHEDGVTESHRFTPGTDAAAVPIVSSTPV